MAQPNILVIYSDQHRYDCVGVNGHPLVKTPNMDRIAGEGVNFTHAFTPAPICVPARCSMLTGRWPSEHGVVSNYDGEGYKPLDGTLPTVPRVLNAAGYQTFHVARWHVDAKRTPLDFGFNHYVPDWRYLKWRAARGLPKVSHGGVWGGTDPASADETSLAWGAGQVIEQMRSAADDGSPFFLRWHMTEPHLPCCPAEPFASMYNPADIPPWPSFVDQFENKPWIQRQMLHTWKLQDKTWDDWAPAVARYLGVISQLDDAMGRVLNELEAMGIAENTVVIYTSDHGDMCGSHRMIDKHVVMYDDVTRVPMMMRYPGVLAPGSVCDAMISNAVDLPATLCAIAGTGKPDTFSGQDFVAWANGSREGLREDIFCTYSGNQFGGYTQRMVRDRRWKYVWNATEMDELYDLGQDPHELKNLAQSRAHEGELRRLRERLVAWMKQVHDPMANHWMVPVLLEGLKQHH